MKKIFLTFSLLTAGYYQGYSFCGFYVASAGAKLFNKASSVIMVRDGNRTVLTMSNDFHGDVKHFAMVVPVPTVLEEKNIRTVNQKIFDQLDAYSGPRLVEYYDNNPCWQREYEDDAYDVSAAKAPRSNKSESIGIETKKDYKVTIEAKYTVGEYDILILSAKESSGLKLWLTDNGYKIPDEAEPILEPYIKSNLKFFIVKVNMDKFTASGYQTLRPLQIEYESPKFMLPIRLGMANSTGSQDLIVYALTNSGRVECTNYRTVKMPTGYNVPLDVQSNFGKFYKAIFKRQYKNEGKNSIFLEYAWNVTPSFNGVKCDPCVGPPPLTAELTEAGVNWLNGFSNKVFFTRLHVRYTKDKFPQDLQFQVTPNQENFQARYIITHPASGAFDCSEGQTYLRKLSSRRKNEVNQLYTLTGWNVENYKTYIYEYNHLLKGNNNWDEEEDESFWYVPVNNNDNRNKKIYMSLLLAIILIVLMTISSEKKEKSMKA